MTVTDHMCYLALGYANVWKKTGVILVRGIFEKQSDVSTGVSEFL